MSLVVNGRADKRINPQLAERIRAAVQELNYQPNSGAQALAMRTPAEVAFLCPDIRNPFFGEMYYGLLERLDNQYRVNLVVSGDAQDYDAATVARAQSGNIAALVVAGPSASVVAEMRETCPTVYIDGPRTPEGPATINIDVESAGRQLAEHLVALGHDRVAYLDIDLDKETFSQRFDALKTSLEAQNATLVARVSSRDLTIEKSCLAFDRVWDEWSTKGVTAVVCAQDMLAFGVIASARQRGIHIPQQLSVCAFDDIEFARFVDPPLTTVHFDSRALGRAAGEQLLGVLEGRAATSMLLPVHIVERQSTSRIR